MSETRTIVGASNLNVEPLSALRYGADEYAQFLDDAGFDREAGYEWNNVRFPRSRHAAEELAQAGLINVVHESWNEHTLLQAAVHGTAAVLGAIALPRLDESYGELEALQDQAGHKLPIIIHPRGQYLGERRPKRPRYNDAVRNFAEVWYQPTAEWAKAQSIDIDTDDAAAVAERIVRAEAKIGLDRRVVDLHHLTAERNNFKFRNIGALAVALVNAPKFGELQVSFRPDFGGKQSQLEMACRGKVGDTEIGKILEQIAAAIEPTRRLRVVTEIPAGAIGKVSDISLAEAHQAINEGIRSILG